MLLSATTCEASVPNVLAAKRQRKEEKGNQRIQNLMELVT